MSETHSYQLPESRDAAEAEIRRLAAQARDGWEREAQALGRLGLRDGMSVLELGSGPGFITAQLIELLPSSPITCVEINPELIAQARQLLGGAVGPRARLVEGSVMDMPLPDGQFDVAYARMLFQHLPDPLGAAREVRRVLRPGGRLIISDIDDRLFGIFEPPIPEFAPVLAAFGRAQAARGGNRHIGGGLWQLLSAAGLTPLEVQVQASSGAGATLPSFLQHIDPDRMRPLVEQGLLSEAELAAYRAALAEYAATPGAYTLWLSLLVSAERPAGEG